MGKLKVEKLNPNKCFPAKMFSYKVNFAVRGILIVSNQGMGVFCCAISPLYLHRVLVFTTNIF